MLCCFTPQVSGEVAGLPGTGRFNNPNSPVYDSVSGSIFVADGSVRGLFRVASGLLSYLRLQLDNERASQGNVIRQVNATTGYVTTYAGCVSGRASV